MEVRPDWRQIEIENRGLRVTSTRFLGEGWSSRAFLVNDQLVFRCPKRREHWDELDREIRFLTFAADKLPLAVPQYIHVSPQSSATTHGYAVYRYLHGRPLKVSELTQKHRADAAERIASFLHALHHLRPSDGVGALLPRDDPQEVAEQWLARAEREVVPRLTAPETQTLRAEFERYLDAEEHFGFDPTVLHADLSGEHLLLQNDSVAAAIDFGDVSWGDPDYDFMYLYIEAGRAFVETVARRYEHADLERLLAKLRYFAIVDQLDTIVNGAGYALAGQEELAWQRLRLFMSAGRG